ncbi:MAG: TlpA family protein disulfide reductase [Candidatus Kariarchaeaceae archaeon]|jgi:thiol-disulfide isomerase/thioredoxin
MQKLGYYPIILLFLMMIIPVNGYGIKGQFTNLDGELEGFGIFEDKPVLIEAFATWCSHCQNEHEELSQLWETDKNATFQMMTLSVDADDDDIFTIQEYLEDYPTPWKVGWDSNEEFKTTYNIQAYPTILLFDAGGDLANCWIGEKSFTSLQSEISAFIGDPVSYKNSNTNDGTCQSPEQQLPTLLIIGFTMSILIAIYFVINSFRKK